MKSVSTPSLLAYSYSLLSLVKRVLSSAMAALSMAVSSVGSEAVSYPRRRSHLDRRPNIASAMNRIGKPSGYESETIPGEEAYLSDVADDPWGRGIPL